MRSQSVNLVSWLGLNIDLPKLIEFSRILILRELLVSISWRLGILCPQISLFVGLLVDFLVAMVMRIQIVGFMVGQSTMMPHLGLSGLRIRYLLAPSRPLWSRNGSSSSYMTLRAWKLSIFMATMVFSHRRSTAWSVPRKSNCSNFLVWEHNIKILKLSERFKQSCIWLAPF